MNNGSCPFIVRIIAQPDTRSVLGWFLQPDPIGYVGGQDLYAYVGNNPLHRVDPSCPDTAVIVGAPIWSNPFGHVAIAVTGQGGYSIGTTEQSGSSTTDYLQQQGSYRSNTVIVLKTTPAQEAAIIQTMATYKGTPYSPYANNCAMAVIDALGSAGIGLDVLATGTVGPPNLPTTAASIAILQPGATINVFTKGASKPPAFMQFDPGSPSESASPTNPVVLQAPTNQPSSSNSDSLAGASRPSSSGQGK